MRITFLGIIVAGALPGALAAQDDARTTREPKPALAMSLDCDAHLAAGSQRPEVSGPHRFVKIGGKIGYQPLSLKSSLRIPTDLHAKNEGSILLSICPMETLAVAAGLPWYLDKDPHAQTFALLSDALPANDLSKSVFSWFWSSRWHPQMVAAFGPRPSDFSLTPCIVVEHLPLREKTWYQLAFTWNKSQHRLRIYVDGILCGTVDYPFDPQPPHPQLYLGNTDMALADLRLYDRELSASQVSGAFAGAAIADDPKVTAELRSLFTVQPRPPADWSPDSTWKLSYQTSFTKPEDLKGWIQQGCTAEPYKMKAMETTPEGLLLQTRDVIDNETRMYLWSPQNFEGDIAVQYDFRPEQDSGLALLVVQASGMQREDFITDHPRRTSGSMGTIICDRVRNYHWEYFRRTGDVRADLGTQVLVKNPWARPLGMSTLDRLAVNQWHRLLFLQEGAHLRAALDGRWVLDLRDDPFINNGPVLNFGRIGLRVMYKTRMRFRDLKVWNRDPGVEIVR
jgi:hypothetical protein